jgi:hypothetical protein
MRPSASASGVDPCCTCCCCLSVLGVRERRRDICGYVYAPRSRSLLRLHLHLIIRSPLPLCRNRGSRGPTPISTLLFPMNSKQERGHKWGGGDRIHHRQLSDASSARSVACAHGMRVSAACLTDAFSGCLLPAVSVWHSSLSLLEFSA